MLRPDLIFYTPEAAAHMQFMAEQFGPADFINAIWHLREIHQDARDAERARVAEILGPLAVLTRGKERKASPARNLRLVEAAE